MKKNLDAVALVRQIRDRIHEETKNLTPEELVAYYRDHSATSQAELKRKLEQRDEES